MTRPQAPLVYGELERLIVEAVLSADEPLPLRAVRQALPRAYRPAREACQQALDALVAAGKLHLWPGRPGGYSGRSFADGRREAARAALAAGPLPAREIVRRAHIPEAMAGTLFVQWIAEGWLFEHAGHAYGTAPESDLDYVLRPELDRLLASYVERGAKADEVRAALQRYAGGALDSPAAAGAGPDPRLLLDRMKHLNPQVVHGAPMYVPHLRTAARDAFPDKLSFDRALLSLVEQNQIVLQSHPVPSQLRAEEKETLVEDGRGSYYLAVRLA